MPCSAVMATHVELLMCCAVWGVSSRVDVTCQEKLNPHQNSYGIDDITNQADDVQDSLLSGLFVSRALIKAGQCFFQGVTDSGIDYIANATDPVSNRAYNAFITFTWCVGSDSVEKGDFRAWEKWGFISSSYKQHRVCVAYALAVT